MAETVPRDYYEVLGVPNDADEKAIKEAFRALALKYHPDRNKEPDAEARFKEIAEAYAVLSDPKKRAEYDARGYAGVAGFSPEDLFGGIDFEEIFGGHDFGFGGNIFDRLFRRHRGPARGVNLEVGLEIPLERVISGGEETVRFPRTSACPVCHGSGARPGTSPRKCTECDGTGRKVFKRQQQNITIQQFATCPACQGRGEFIDKPCHECHGSGEVERTDTITVKIPVGVEEGMALRVAGHGMASPESGGTPGDLFVVIRSQPDPRFERQGVDLWRTQTLELTDAVLGTTVEVPTLDEAVTVTIAPGTQPDSVLRLRGKGLPAFGAGPQGDLYLNVRVRIPEHLSKEERQHFERLRELHGPPD
jgi:molecular chaperone DnaJ